MIYGHCDDTGPNRANLGRVHAGFERIRLADLIQRLQRSGEAIRQLADEEHGCNYRAKKKYPGLNYVGPDDC